MRSIFKIGREIFSAGNELIIMGILNITPDSFYDGGKYLNDESIRNQINKMISEGVNIIDVGGESTRPNYAPISIGEEIERVVPVIEMISREYDIPISVDTSKAVVAEAAIKAGASMINDVWGLKRDHNMAKVIALYDVSCCLMHNRRDIIKDNIMETIVSDLSGSIDIALRAGIDLDKIVIDPGIGFAKDYAQNIEILKNLDYLKQLGFPILIGTSNKSFIGETLGKNVDERVEGTMATTAVGVMKGASIFRVHNVKENRLIAEMAYALS